jgi:hypothetical protein
MRSGLVRLTSWTVALIVAASISAAGQTSTFPLGTFAGTDADNNVIALTFDSTGTIHAWVNNQEHSRSAYSAKGEEVEVREVSGPAENSCGSEVGKYKWKLENSRLIFTAVSDNCQIRAQYLTGLSWVRQ